MLMVISPLITSPYLSRVLGAENIGIYSYCHSIAFYFGIFAILGIGNYGNRAISRVCRQGRERISREFCEIYCMQAMASIVVLFAYLVYVISFSGAYRIIFLFEILYVLSVGMDISWLYFGMEKFEITTKLNFSVRVITIISILLFVKTVDDLKWYAFIMSGGSFAANLVLWMGIGKCTTIVKIEWRNVIRHFKPNFILFIPNISLAVFHYMDKVMVGILSTMDEVGYYANADKVINIPLGLITALGVVMMPRITKLEEEGNSKAVAAYIENSLIFSSWMGIAMSVGIMAVSSDFVPVFFGNGFEACVNLLRLFGPAVFIKAWSGAIKNQYIVPSGKDKELNFSVVGAAAVNLILNGILIPVMGSMGAVIGTFAAELSLLIFYMICAKKKINFLVPLKWTMLFVGIGMVMFLFVIFITSHISSNVVSLLAGVGGGAAVYCGLSVMIFHIFHWKPFLDMRAQVLSRFRKRS